MILLTCLYLDQLDISIMFLLHRLLYHQGLRERLVRVDKLGGRDGQEFLAKVDKPVGADGQV
jgi:hypothetical protein